MYKYIVKCMYVCMYVLLSHTPLDSFFPALQALEAVLIAREKKVRELEGGAEHLATRYQVFFYLPCRQ
jgi:hypothetical protein